MTAAVAYGGQWLGVGELNLGLQKTDYRKRVGQPGQPSLEGKDSPWLYSVGGALHATTRLAFYGGYTTGLEEGGVAPSNAVNKDAAPPAIRTRQWDAGLRYALTSRLKLVAGVFDIRKPYYALDSHSVYRLLGEERHEGVEISLSGEPIKGLNLVAGTVLMRPRVSREDVAAGRIGDRPVGQTDRVTIVSAEYQLPFAQPLSVGATLISVGNRVASSDSRLSIPARSVIDLSARYRFKVGTSPATLRVALENVFDTFGWRTSPSAAFVTNAPRRLSATLAADF